MKTIAAGLFLAICGCGTTSGFLRDATTLNQHQYQTDVTQVRFVKTTQGEWSINQLFCLVPLSSGAYMHAMEELHKDAALKPNQVLENIREDHNLTCLIFWGMTETVVSADVVEITPRDGLASHIEHPPPWRQPAEKPAPKPDED